jgi:hypothetical protein
MSTGDLTVDASLQCSLCHTGTIWTNASEGSATNITMVGPTCQDCAEGEYNTIKGSMTCQECPAGYMCNSIGLSAAKPCPQGTYNDRLGRTTCQQCPLGEITPSAGATSEVDCVSPVYNFYLGFVCLAVIIVVSYPYLFRARFERIAFFRKRRVGDNLVEESWSIFPKLHDYYYHSKAKGIKLTGEEKKSDQNSDRADRMNENEDEDDTVEEGMESTTTITTASTEPPEATEASVSASMHRVFRVLSFIFLSLIIISMGSMVIYIGLLLSTLFKALIIWKNLNIDLSFFETFSNFVYQLASRLYFPPVSQLLTPFIYVLHLLSRLEVDMAPVAVSCAGAAAPLEVLVNLGILGIVIILIESDFQVYRTVSHLSLTKTFLQVIVAKEYRKYFWNHYQAWYCVPLRFAILCMKVILAYIAGNLDFFQTALLAVVSFVTLNKFVEDEGVHSYSKSCNQVHGYVDVDRVLALSASVLAWILLMPAI